MATKQNKEVQALVQAALQDEEVYARAKRFTNRLISEAEYMLDHGNPYFRLQLIRTGMGNIMKQVQDEKVDSELETIRDEHNKLRNELRGELKERKPLPRREVVPIDRARKPS